MTKEKSKTKTGSEKGILYLLIGGGIGAILALLFAPKAGKQLRGEIGDAAQKSFDKTGEFAGKIGGKANDFYQDAKNKTGEVYEAAKLKIESATASVTETAGELKTAAANETAEIPAGITAAKKSFDGGQK